MKLGFWGLVWAIWTANLTLVILFFLGFEGAALFGKTRGDTLSEQVWWLRDHNHWLYYVILDVVVVAAITFVWLVYHFRFQGRPST